MKIGLLGGSFDPIHNTHLSIAIKAKEELSLDQIWFIPTGNNPWKDQFHSTKEQRLYMLSLAMQKDDSFHINRIEIDTDGTQKNFTIDTIEELKKQSPHDQFYFIMGMDQAQSFAKWKDAKLISELVQLVCFDREGYDRDFLSEYNFIFIHDNPTGTSSTKVRLGDLNHVPIEVKQYIIEHGLYLNERVSKRMSQKRFEHTLSVAALSLEIAKGNGINENKAYIAAMLHDIAKEMPIDETMEIMNTYFKENSHKPTQILHQWTSAYIAYRDFCIDDREILDAISVHTTASTHMSRLAKCVYVADKIEPNRPYDTSAQIAQAIQNIDISFANELENFKTYALKKGIELDQEFIKIYKTYRKQGE